MSKNTAKPGEPIWDSRNSDEPPQPVSVVALAAKVDALEKLVIELAVIAVSTAQIKHHYKARLDVLLGELQYAGTKDAPK